MVKNSLTVRDNDPSRDESRS